MIRWFILIAICFLRSTAGAQDCEIITGSAYQRTTIPGNIPGKDLDESGKEVEKPVKVMNTYFIYVQTKPNCILKPTRIWIAGKAYHVTLEEIINIPVVVQHSHPGTPADTLVKHTTNKVFRIQPTQEWQYKPGKKILSRQKDSKIIIEYMHGSRTASFSIREIKRIAPMVLQ